MIHIFGDEKLAECHCHVNKPECKKLYGLIEMDAILAYTIVFLNIM